MTCTPAHSLSAEGERFQHRVNSMLQLYENSLGPVPVWFAELDLDRSLSLLDVCLRIGLKLPAEETLQADMAERSNSQMQFKSRRSSNYSDPVRKSQK